MWSSVTCAHPLRVARDPLHQRALLALRQPVTLAAIGHAVRRRLQFEAQFIFVGHVIANKHIVDAAVPCAVHEVQDPEVAVDTEKAIAGKLGKDRSFQSTTVRGTCNYYSRTP